MDLRLSNDTGDVFALKGFSTQPSSLTPTGVASDGGTVRGELQFGSPEVGQEYRAEDQLPEGCRRVRVRELRPDGSETQRVEVVCDVLSD